MKKNEKKKIKTLHLSRETLQILTSSEGQNVMGGVDTTCWSWWPEDACYTA